MSIYMYVKYEYDTLWESTTKIRNHWTKARLIGIEMYVKLQTTSITWL